MKSSIRLFLILGALFVGSECNADPARIGVPAIPKDLSIVFGDHPAAKLVRDATSVALTKLDSNSTLGYRLAFAEQMVADPSKGTWSFRIPRGVRFSSGKRVVAEDVSSSLSICKSQRILSGVRKIAVRSERNQFDTPPYDSAVDWVDIEAVIPTSDFNSFPGKLSQCPILEKESTERFGSELGKGGNFVGSGRFQLTRLVLGREFELSRVGEDLGERGSSEQIVVEAYPDSNQGLSALRVGTLDALFTNSEDVLKKAELDQTLGVSLCEHEHLIVRKGFTLSCTPSPVTTGLRYVS